MFIPTSNLGGMTMKPDETEYMECAYCNAELIGNPDTRPIPQSEEEWAEEARLHHPTCEWVLTHAHTRDKDQ